MAFSTGSLDVVRQAEAELLADVLHPGFSGRMTPEDPARCFSSRPIAISRSRNAVPSPRLWKRSLIRRANSASSVPRILLSRPTPRISWLAGLGVGPLGDQDHLAVVVDEADPRQPLVRDPRAQLHRVEVAERDGPLGKRAVERDQQGSSSGRIGRSGAARAVLGRPGTDVLALGYGRIAGRGSSASPMSGPWTITRASSASSRSGEASNGLMSISLIHRCSTTRLAEPNQKLLERGQVHRRAAAHALERGEDLGLLHHPPGQRGVERRQPQGAVPEDLDELAARAEEQHRAELRVEAAADDQLVAVELDHRLHADALEVPSPGPLAD